MSDTLVIHPKDDSTVMLNYVYEGKGFDVINDPEISKEQIIEEIKAHKRIIILGHGTAAGLIHPDLIKYGHLKKPQSRFYLIDDSIAPYFLDKETISVWCFSSDYFKRNHLSGFHTGMIISEPKEAYMFLGSCPLNETQLFQSMCDLGRYIGESIDLSPIEMREYVLSHYSGNDAITQYNRKNITVL